MRTFSLINGAGQVCNLTDPELFFHDPSQLGFERKLNYRQVGDRFARVNKKITQKDIKGKVALIGEDPYLSYSNFLSFINREPLILTYRPNDQASERVASGITYRRNVDVKSITKSEMNKSGYLDCDIVFTPLTPWYQFVAISNSESPIIGEPLKWGVTWGIQWGPLDEFSRGIKSSSVLDGPTRLTIYGPITNPTWTHYVNGIEFATGKVTATISTDQYLVVDCSSDPFVIEKRNATNDTFLADLYESSDFSTKRFIKMQYGTNTVSAIGSNNEKPIIKLEAYIYHESV